MLGKEGPKLPLLQLILATTYSELYYLEEQLLLDIINITKEGDRLNGPGPLLIETLPNVLLRIIEFIEIALLTCGPNNKVAYWAK